MTVLIIIGIAITLLIVGFRFSLTLGGRNSFSAKIGDSSDGLTDLRCRKCGGNNFTTRTTDLNPLGVIRRSMTETVCQMCGEIMFKSYNSYRENRNWPEDVNEKENE